MKDNLATGIVQISNGSATVEVIQEMVPTIVELQTVLPRDTDLVPYLTFDDGETLEEDDEENQAMAWHSWLTQWHRKGCSRTMFFS